MNKRIKRLSSLILAAALAAGSAASASAESCNYEYWFSRLGGNYAISVESDTKDSVMVDAYASGCTVNKVVVTLKNTKTGKTRKVKYTPKYGAGINKTVKKLKGAKYKVTVKMLCTKKNGKKTTIKKSGTLHVK